MCDSLKRSSTRPSNSSALRLLLLAADSSYVNISGPITVGYQNFTIRRNLCQRGQILLLERPQRKVAASFCQCGGSLCYRRQQLRFLFQRRSFATCFIKRPLSLVVAAAYLKVLQLRYILSSLNCSEIHVYHMCVSRLSSFINIDLSETPFIKDDSGHFNAIILHLILVIFHLFFS